ncbi:MAG: hypothetical protein KGI08_04595 [Thaumarchaeota archaeon]|nr:hypothetical protein [Nitrososphaerota archaeon]
MNKPKLLVDEFSNPLIEDYCSPGIFTSEGKPKATGKWKMRGKELFIQLKFTKKGWFKDRKVLKYVHENYIKILEPEVYFTCGKE